jgi:hypothetical protein
MSKEPLTHDGRLIEVVRLGILERDLTQQAVAVRETIAELVASLLPPHAPEALIVEVVKASGYSRTLIDGLRSRNHSWHEPRPN